ncbi:MAG: 5-(carboxyamino)imidazole ribonucleotide synthase, partial [Bdellovibrionales bacterium]|nr:5-(carboxyamino)imidazole ribonucleotide synthase [Bdellovibrionales bacterium]
MRIGIFGGGQLARLLVLEGSRLGLSFRIFDAAPHSSTCELAPFHQGAFDDQAALRSFAKSVDVVTVEFENVPAEACDYVSQFVPCYPPAQAFAASQDRLTEKQLFERLQIPTAGFAAVASVDELLEAEQRFGYPLLLKRRRFGYDGKGQWRITDRAQGKALVAELGGERLITESIVPFDRELSIIAAISRSGERTFYPLVQTVHQQGILHTATAPAPRLTEALVSQAVGYANRIADELHYVGVFALELFELQGQLLANEMAPRVHNSGHWTLDGSVTSQFENHLRAILGLPLGSTESLGTSVMRNIIGTFPPKEKLLQTGLLHLHDYTKEPHPGRKLGHVTAVAD